MRQTTTDIAAAFLIGAALGIGATLLMRLDLDDERKELLRIVRHVRGSRRRGGGAGRRMRRLIGAARDRW